MVGCQMSDWIMHDGKKYFEEGYLIMANKSAERRGKRIKELESFVKDIRDGFDCDLDAHKYGTLCRCCEAEKILGKCDV